MSVATSYTGMFALTLWQLQPFHVMWQADPVTDKLGPDGLKVTVIEALTRCANECEKVAERLAGDSVALPSE